MRPRAGAGSMSDGAFLAAVIICAVAYMLAPRAGADQQDRASISSGGMEGLEEVRIQVHVAAGADWRALTELDENVIRERAEVAVSATPGLASLGDEAAPETPRLLVMVVGHLIADADGNKDTAAANLSISLHQPVVLTRTLDAEAPAVTSAMTWHRSLLTTGTADYVKGQAAGRLGRLLDQFRQEYLRVNAPTAPATTQ